MELLRQGTDLPKEDRLAVQDRIIELVQVVQEQYGVRTVAVAMQEPPWRDEGRRKSAIP
jgi:hypothetical protein